MPPRPDEQFDEDELAEAVLRPPRQFARRAAAILWPSFLIAGALEMATFALVDPGDLQLLDAGPIQASREAIYSVAFLVYWGFVSLSAALTVLLLVEPEEQALPSNLPD